MTRIHSTALATLVALALGSPSLGAPPQIFGPEIGLDRFMGVRISLGDLDGDGDIDLLGGQEALTWFQGRGDGRFEGRRRIGPQDAIGNASASYFKGTDMDGDGDLDVALSRLSFHQSNYLAWHENLGADGFGPMEILVQMTVLVRATLSVDLNGDGLPDFVVLEDSGRLGWYKNLGIAQGQSPRFGPFRSILAPTVGMRLTRAGDVDGDGDMDLVSLRRPQSFQPTQLHYSENLGAGVFAPVRISDSASRSESSLALADMDLDGDCLLYTSPSPRD